MAVPLIYLDPYYYDIVQKIANDILAKTKVFNPSADTWRFLRPEDLGLTAVEDGGAYAFSVAPGVQTIVTHTVAPGIGIGIFGVICDGDFGAGAAMIIKINTVKRAEYPLSPVYNSEYKFGIFPDQVVYAKQHDKIEILIANQTDGTVSATVFPLGVIAGESKTLLVSV